MTDYELLVVSPFLNYQRGERIMDRETVEKLADSAYQAHFVKVAAEPPAKKK